MPCKASHMTFRYATQVGVALFGFTCGTAGYTGSYPMTKQPKKPQGGMSVREAGRKGGQTVKERYGSEFYENIGRKGGEATRSTHGHEFYESIGKLGGKKGGESTRARYGPKFYETIGQKGGQKVKRLIEEGKKASK